MVRQNVRTGDMVEKTHDVFKDIKISNHFIEQSKADDSTHGHPKLEIRLDSPVLEE